VKRCDWVYSAFWWVKWSVWSGGLFVVPRDVYVPGVGIREGAYWCSVVWGRVQVDKNLVCVCEGCMDM
jgi:hypothetical protein